MKSLRLSRYALTSCLAIAKHRGKRYMRVFLCCSCSLLTTLVYSGCSEGPINTLSSGSATASRESFSRSRATSQPLMYVSFSNSVSIFTYPEGQLIGAVTGVQSPGFPCSDDQGNVYVPDINAARILVYAHGGTSPTATLADPGYRPEFCAIDPTTGNLAVSNFNSAPTDGQGNIAIYEGATGVPTLHADPDMKFYASCAYDDEGNLFVIGDSGAPFAELSKGSNTFDDISVPFTGLVFTQWDGKYIAVSSDAGNDIGTPIYRLKITGSTAHIVGEVPIKWGSRKVRLASFIFSESRLVSNFKHYVGSWGYPKARKPKIIFRHYGSMVGIALSWPPSS